MRRIKDVSSKVSGFHGKTIALIAACVFLFSFHDSRSGSAAQKKEINFTQESIRAHHQALVGIASRAGGLKMGIHLNDAGKKAADYLRAGYRKAGLRNVRFEEFTPNRWWPEKYGITVLGDKKTPDVKLAAYPLWNSGKGSGKAAEVVYAGFGTSGEFRGLDVKGKVVLIDMKRILHFIASYKYTGALKRAQEKGAVGVIVAETRIASPSGNELGTAGPIKDQKGGKPDLFPLPVLSVGRADGELLKARLNKGHVKAVLTLEYSLKPWPAVNIVGELPGNGSIDEYIIVGGHYDSWFNGAIDNLASQASLLEMAKYFAAIPQAKRNRHMIFASIFGHEFGNDAMGHAAFVERRANIRDKITCFVNIDGSGSNGWEERDDSGTILPTGMDDKAGIFTSSWALTALARKAVYPYAKGPWGQYPLNSFVADLAGPISNAGFPVLLIISKHIYYHSMLDSIDRITSDQVYRRTLMNIDIINGLLDSPKGYYMSVDTNPNRKLKKGEKAGKDLTPADMPRAPKPMLEGPPKDLSFHIIPSTARIFSPVIVWPGFWRTDDIIFAENISWNFGIPFWNTNKIATGTIFLIPGNRTIKMTVTDSQGRKTTVKRKVRITW